MEWRVPGVACLNGREARFLWNYLALACAFFQRREPESSGVLLKSRKIAVLRDLDLFSKMTKSVLKECKSKYF